MSDRQNMKKPVKVTVPKVGPRNPDILVCAFRVPKSLRPSFTTEISWSPSALPVLKSAGAALSVQGLNAPVGALRFALDTVTAIGRHVEDKLYKFDSRPFARFDFGSDTSSGERALRDRVSLWLRNTLLRCVEQKKLDGSLVGALQGLIDKADFLVVSPCADQSGKDVFLPRRSLVFAMVEEAIKGHEVFPGVPPLMRQHGEALADKLVLTSPVMEFTKGKGTYPGSLELRFEMKNIHGTDEAILLVSGGRKSWGMTPSSPDYKLSAQLHFPGEFTSHTVVFAKGEETLDTSRYFPSYLDAFDTVGKETLKRSDITESQDNSLRLVRPLIGRARRVGRGLPYYDLSAAVTNIRPLMAAAGFDIFAEVGPRPSVTDGLGFEDGNRPSFGSKKLSHFLAASDAVRGPAQLDIFEMQREQFVREELLGHFGIDTTDGGAIREKDIERWHGVAARVGFDKRKLAVISMDDEDRDSLSRFVPFYLGIKQDGIVPLKLPPGVHGIAPPSYGSPVSETERFKARSAAWTPLIREIQRLKVTDVLVVAAKAYDGVDEDSINKRTAKYLFASAGISSQYLIPRTEEERENDKSNEAYLQRVQSAIRDLYFGQQGYVDVPSDFASRMSGNGFVSPHVYAISLLKHNRKIERASKPKPAASVMVCTRLDVRTGLIDATVFDGSGAVSGVEWWPYPVVLRNIARTPSQKFLDGDTGKQKNAVASALRRLLDEIASSDPDALVMVDPSSGKLQQLWPWLQVANVRSPVFTDQPDTSNPLWGGLTFLVADDRIAPHMMGCGKGRDNFYSFTEVVEKVACEGDFGIWWYQARNRSTSQLARTSCYAADRNGKAPLSAAADFMMPRPVQVLVRGPAVDADRGHFIVTLFKQLRSHHLTYADESTYPSPLFEHGRLKRDMCRLVRNGLETEFYVEQDDVTEDD